jgi:hypothetical protein
LTEVPENTEPVEEPMSELEAAKLTNKLSDLVELRDDELDALVKRENITLGLFFTVVLVGILAIVYALIRIQGIVESVQNTQKDVNAISAAPQSGAAANRKFIFLVHQCQKTTKTVQELDDCVGAHFKLQYKCGQDKHDDRICTPFIVKND